VVIALQVVATIVVVIAVIALVLAVVIVIVVALVVVIARQVVAAIAAVVAVVALVLAVVIVIVAAFVIAAIEAFAAVAFPLAAGARGATAAPSGPPTRFLEFLALAFCFSCGFAPALPVSGAHTLEGFAGLRDHVFRCRAAAGKQATDTSGRNRLEQPAPSAAGGTQLEERIERLAVHAVSPFGVHRHPSVIHRHAPRR
jgi:hypothetical protein